MKNKRNYFGTDGIRGFVGQFPITPDFVLKLGWAAGRVLTQQQGHGAVLIGKDTRISGYMFESALEAGFAAAGVDCHLLGPMPTPAIAYLTRTLRVNAGVVISASHNLYHDNGIKFFSADGMKLPDEIELQIEQQLELPLKSVASEKLGKASRIKDAPGRYIEFCKSTVPFRLSLKGIKIVIDCANGATYHVAPDVFRELGAEVIELSVDPDGLNINDSCGATQPSILQRIVVAEEADLGIALDGDGDRLIMVDQYGEVVDGDEILYIIANHLISEGRMHSGLVGTLMSNYGLELAMREKGIDFVRAKVGDRYVLEEMLARNWVLGGESSGHVICLDVTTTGDGIITALQVLTAMMTSGKTLNELKHGMEKSPQVLINVKVPKKNELNTNTIVQKTLKQAEEKLGQRGRILLRPSGTEPVIRVMTEGQDEDLITEIAQMLVDVIQKELS